jgi:hypothetical protein
MPLHLFHYVLRGRRNPVRIVRFWEIWQERRNGEPLFGDGDAALPWFPVWPVDGASVCIGVNFLGVLVLSFDAQLAKQLDAFPDRTYLLTSCDRIDTHRRADAFWDPQPDRIRSGWLRLA